MAVAAVTARARDDQVADAAQSGERLRRTAQEFAQTPHFGDSAGHERGFRIVSEFHPVDDPGRDRHDVLERSAEFDTDDVTAGIDAEVVVDEEFLHKSGVLGIPGGGDHGGRNPARHLLRMARPREYRVPVGPEHLFDHLVDQKPAVDFDPLGHVEQKMFFRMEVRFQGREHAAQILGRRRKHQQFRSVDRAGDIRLKFERVRQPHAGKETDVLMFFTHFGEILREGTVHDNLMAVVDQSHRQGGPPGAVA